jgi:hypothetical protein
MFARYVAHQVEHHRGRWIATGVVLFFLLLLIAARIALTPIVARELRTQLNAQPDMSGDFDDLALSVLSAGAHLEGVVLHMTPPGGAPISVSVKSLEGHLRWHDLIHSHFVVDAWLDHAKATVVIETPGEMNEMVRQIQHVASMPHLGAKLESQPAFDLASLEIHQFEVLIANHTETGVSRKSAEIWMHGIEGTLENLADRAPLLGGKPTTLTLKGDLQRSGAVSLFISAEPLADQLDLAAKLSLKHLDLRELYGFIAPKTKLQVEGTVDADVSLKVHDAKLDGAIKPNLENLHLSPAEANLVPELEATLGNAVVGIAASHGAGHTGSATVIPISGWVNDPKIDFLPALLILLQNTHQTNP